MPVKNGFSKFGIIEYLGHFMGLGQLDGEKIRKKGREAILWMENRHRNGF